MRQARELAGRDALDVEKADHCSQPQQRDEAEALDVELQCAVERPPANDLDQDDDQEPGGDACFSAKEQSWGTAWRTRSLLATASAAGYAPGELRLRVRR